MPKRSIGLITVISSISGEAGDRLVNLIKQIYELADVTAILIAEDLSNNFTRVSIHCKVQFTPSSGRFAAVFVLKPLACSINLQARSIHKNMNWFIRCGCLMTNQSLRK
ncbi:hypothetical protein OHAE_5313 [Ochrobactrum soli]|uniref:Uncharacterized protein n=1 Tax=Ochrobactrum soli TaxID=2448455 RepID=A0A2P9HF31_9HYPH|nr:hypothetical protein OHAE_5313 [[Ochrobactrum] soli]